MAAPPKLVLVADDDPQVGLLVRKVLTQDGYAVDVYPDGGSALEAAERGGYALLVLDVLMPHKTGIEIVQELRGKADPVPVVLISSFSGEEVAAAIQGMSQVAFLQKPFTLADLRQAVAKVLGRVPC